MTAMPTITVKCHIKKHKIEIVTTAVTKSAGIPVKDILIVSGIPGGDITISCWNPCFRHYNYNNWWNSCMKHSNSCRDPY